MTIVWNKKHDLKEYRKVIQQAVMNKLANMIVQILAPRASSFFK